MYDVIVIGGGAAGLMAAGVAASKGMKVLVAEKMEKSARKVRITGKGRCNLTNNCSKAQFLSKVKCNADFFESQFRRFTNTDTVGFFRNEGVQLTVERGGRVFPSSGNAWEIADALRDFATESGAEISYNTKVTEISTLGSKIYGVKIVNKRGFERNIQGKNVIIATGGASYPATGSTGDGYSLAHSLGHKIVPIMPSLVSLQSDSPLAESLRGIKLKNVRVTLYIDGEEAANEFGEMEFGTRGIEGAVILRLSRIAVEALTDGRQVEISIDLKTALNEEKLAARIERELAEMDTHEKTSELLRKLLPKPMIGPFAKKAAIDPTTPVASLKDKHKFTIIRLLKRLVIPVTNYGGFETAIVTAGGVCVDQIEPETLQSTLVKGLYFAGEVLDIDADTGGYNLQIAFSTGNIAGQLLAK